MQQSDPTEKSAAKAAAASPFPLMAAGTLLAAALLGPWLTEIPLDRAALAAAVVLVSLYGFISGVFPRVRPIQAIAFGFALPYLGVAPIYQMAKQEAAWFDSALMYDTNSDHLIFALVLNLCFLLALLIGFRQGAARGGVETPSLPVRTGVRMMLPWVYVAAAAALTPGAVAAAGGWSGPPLDGGPREILDTRFGAPPRRLRNRTGVAGDPREPFGELTVSVHLRDRFSCLDLVRSARREGRDLDGGHHPVRHSRGVPVGERVPNRQDDPCRWSPGVHDS